MRSAAAVPRAHDGRVLIEGATCWRLEHAARMAVIIDAADYFAHLKAAIINARHSILLVGWDFDPRVELERGGGGERPGVPNSIGDLLHFAVRRHRRLRVHVLRWDLAFVKMPVRGTTSALLLDWLSPHRLNFRMDGHHPPGACHHQKIAVIDDAVAFCGGIDVTGGRWDTPGHDDDHPEREWPGGQAHGPWHDATTAVDGAAARALGDLARDRWFAANGWRPRKPPAGLDRWPDALEPTLRDVAVGIARTQPAHGRLPEVREIEALYLAAIASARRSIYLESQYFAAHRIASALAARLAEADGPELIIINPKRADGWLEEQAMGSARALLIGRLRAADAHGRLRFATPVTARGDDIYVHAKILIVDDTLIRIGSSNINNRSLGIDTECDIAVEVTPGATGAAELRASITRVLHTLIAEHLAVPRSQIEETLALTRGSLTGVLDRLMRRQGKTLVAFEPPELTQTARTLAETRLLDAERPEPISTTVVRALRVLPPVRTAAATLAFAAIALAAWLGWRARKRAAQGNRSG